MDAELNRQIDDLYNTLYAPCALQNVPSNLYIKVLNNTLHSEFSLNQCTVGKISLSSNIKNFKPLH
jgi:hypothetical protein